MKRLLISLVPWMAMTAVARQDAPRIVEVVYSNIGPAEAWRVGDECYVAPNIITSWHWPYTVSDGEATIQAEGRTVRVQLKTVHQRELFPVKAIVEQLGATCKWHGDSEMDVLGEVRIVSLSNQMLAIDTTISSKPHIFSLDDPGRLVIDIRGMLLGAQAANNLPENVQASQYGPDTVRVVYTSDDVPRLTSLTNDPARHFEYKVDFPKRTPYRTGSPDLVAPEVEPQDGDGRDTSRPPADSTPAPPSAVSAQQPVITSESSRSTTLNIPLSAPLAGAVQWRRDDLYTFEITIPGAHFAGRVTKPESETIQTMSVTDTAGGSVVRMTTSRPVGVELSTVDNVVQLTLRKPTGSGRLTGRTIVIDPGHGGKDSGARSPASDLCEKQLTLQIGEDLAASLSSAGATVLMTRDSDVFIPLPDRPAVANRANADLFISVHVNSNAVSGSRSGTTTYYHAQDSAGKNLAECVEHEIALVSGMPMLGTASDCSRYKSGFAVLRGCKMPCILIETGYINTLVDRNRLVDPTVQKGMAAAIVKGVKEFLGDAKQEADAK